MKQFDKSEFEHDTILQEPKEIMTLSDPFKSS